VVIYHDNFKRTQPLTSGTGKGDKKATVEELFLGAFLARQDLPEDAVGGIRGRGAGDDEPQAGGLAQIDHA
jgi:hypothetical protein